MPFFETCFRVFRPSVLLALAVALSLFAAEPAPKFVADLLHVARPIHITPDVHVSYFSAPREQGAVKATISPQVWCASKTLLGKVFDISMALREGGLTLPKGSHALYSPESQLLYIHSTSEDVGIANAMFYEAPPPTAFTVDLKAIVKSATREETLLDVKSVPLIEGREMEFNATGQESVHLKIMPRISFGGYDDALFIELDAKASTQGKSISVLNTWLMRQTKPVEAMLGKLGETTVTLSMQTHSLQGRWGDDAESEKEGKAAAIKEIREALKPAE